MIKIIILSVFATLIGLSNSVSVVNNITIPSDFIQTIFIDEVRANLEIQKLENTNIEAEQKCVFHLNEIVSKFPSLKVASFFDSWGKIPSGLLYGHLTDLGNFDQCVKSSVILDEKNEVINGQYCFASVPLPLNTISNSFQRENILEQNEEILRQFLQIKLGICLPDTCNPKLITGILQRALTGFYNGMFRNITVLNCSVDKSPKLEPIDIFSITVFSIIGLLLISNTLYDCFVTYFNKKPIEMLLAFSVLTNGRKLFTITTEKSPNNITCLTGIRVISMIWVLYGHSYMFYTIMNLTNTLSVLSWVKTWWAMTVLTGTLSVDSFFFLSGLLVAWLGLRELDKTKGKLNVFLMWFHRYIRLTPAVAAGILFFISINKYIGSGPFRQETIETHYKPCIDNWWATLLYVQNYATPDNLCYMQSWYLAVDTQLYFLSPLVLIPLWKWGKKIIPALIALILISIGCVVWVFFSEGYTSFIEFLEPNRITKTYYPTHLRCGPWIIGVILGYFMHVNRQKAMRPRLTIQLFGWIISFGTFLAIFFGPYFSISSERTASVAEAAAYESLKRVSWSIALGWIVFACHFGFGGLVNSFLSHPLWQPLGRLNYSMYLVHLGVVVISYGTAQTDALFSNYRLILSFWSSFGISFLVATVLSLAFESPVLVIEKLLIGSKTRVPDPTPIISPNTKSNQHII